MSMEVVTTLEELVVLVGLNQQDEPIAYIVSRNNQIWRTVPILWSKAGIERIEVYDLSLAAKLKTIEMGETEG